MYDMIVKQNNSCRTIFKEKLFFLVLIYISFYIWIYLSREELKASTAISGMAWLSSIYISNLYLYLGRMESQVQPSQE